jgi:hypothetical protein
MERQEQNKHLTRRRESLELLRRSVVVAERGARRHRRLRLAPGLRPQAPGGAPIPITYAPTH